MTAKAKNPTYRYSIIPARAVTDPNITAQALRVLALLGRHTDENGWCRRSQVKMAGELSCGRATVQRGLDELVAAGYVEKRRETRTGFDVPDDEQPHTAHSYRVRLDLEDEPVDAGAHGRAPAVPTGGQGVPAQDGHGVPTPRAPIIELSPIEHSPLNTLAPADAGESEGVTLLGKEDFSLWPMFLNAIADTWPGGFPDPNLTACKVEFGKLTRTVPAGLLVEFARLHGAYLHAKNAKRPKSAGEMLFKEPASWLRSGEWQGYSTAAEKAREVEGAITSAVGRVKRGLGTKLFEWLRNDRGMADASLALLDGSILEAGPPPVITVSGYGAKILLERHTCALERMVGQGLTIIQVPNVRRA